MSIIEEPGTPLQDLALISIVPYPKWKFVSKQTKLYVNGVDHGIRIGMVLLGFQSQRIWTLSGLYCRGWMFALEQHLDDSEEKDTRDDLNKEVRLIGIKDNFYGVFKVYRNANLLKNRTFWRVILNRYVAENFLERLIPGFMYESSCQFQTKNVPETELYIKGGIFDETTRYDYLQKLRQFRFQNRISWSS